MTTCVTLLGKVCGYQIAFKLSELVDDSNTEITEQIVTGIINSVLDANRIEYRSVFPMNPVSDDYRQFLKVIGDTLDSTGWTLRLRKRKPQEAPAPAHAHA